MFKLVSLIAMKTTNTKSEHTKDLSTEEKIKAAAREVFLQKGFAAARTRDIAELAGINLALLNYYFRSKQKLFEVVMQEKMGQFIGTIIPVLNNPKTTLNEKLVLLAENYITMLLENPHMPSFVLEEIKKNHFEFIQKINPEKTILQSPFFQQLKLKRKDVQPVQFLITMLGMIVFPFVAKPLLTKAGLVNEKAFHTMMAERKQLIPVWMKAILDCS